MSAPSPASLENMDTPTHHLDMRGHQGSESSPQVRGSTTRQGTPVSARTRTEQGGACLQQVHGKRVGEGTGERVAFAHPHLPHSRAFRAVAAEGALDRAGGVGTVRALRKREGGGAGQGARQEQQACKTSALATGQLQNGVQ